MPTENRSVSMELNYWKGTEYSVSAFSRLQRDEPIEIVLEITGEKACAKALSKTAMHDDLAVMVVTGRERGKVFGTIQLPGSSSPGPTAATAVAKLAAQIEAD